MYNDQQDESLGVEHLPQSELESIPGLGAALSTDEDTDELQNKLRSLVKDQGLVAVLEALKTLVETQTEKLNETSTQQYSDQIKAFQDTANSLETLIKALPAELDVEIALAQITHTGSVLEPTPMLLTEESMIE